MITIVDSMTQKPAITVEVNALGAVKYEEDTTKLNKKPQKPRKGREDKRERGSRIRILNEILSTCYGCAFLLLYICLSAGQSIVDNLVFLYFESALKAKYILMGYAIVITVMVEIPSSQLAPKMVKVIGSDAALVVAALAYSLRVACYSLLTPKDVYYILPLELLHGISFAGTLSAVSDFASKVLPDEDQAMGEDLVYSMRGWFMSGGIVFGAWVQQVYGPQFLYREASRAVFVGSVSFVLALVLIKLLSLPSSGSKAKRKEREKDAPYHDEECGTPQRRPSTDSSLLFRDVSSRDFDDEDVTTGVDTKTDQAHAIHEIQLTHS